MIKAEGGIGCLTEPPQSPHQAAASPALSAASLPAATADAPPAARSLSAAREVERPSFGRSVRVSETKISSMTTSVVNSRASTQGADHMTLTITQRALFSNCARPIRKFIAGEPIKEATRRLPESSVALMFRMARGSVARDADRNSLQWSAHSHSAIKSDASFPSSSRGRGHRASYSTAPCFA